MSYIDPDEVHILGKHLVITDALKDYVLEKLAHIEMFGDKKAKVTVTLEQQKLHNRCEIFFAIDHTHIKVHAATDEMYAAIDKATDRLKGKLRKYKTKIQAHHAKPLQMVEMTVNVVRASGDDLEEINEEIEEENHKEMFDLYKPHEVVSQEKMHLKTLTQQEAVLKMDLSGRDFIVYRSEEDQKIKVIHKREDGDYGVIEPE